MTLLPNCPKIKIPKMTECTLGHILVIPDGNRRYAHENSLSLNETYRRVATVVVPEIIRFFLVERRTRQLSMYAVSYHNVRARSMSDLEPILRSQATAYESWLQAKDFSHAGIRFHFVGEKDILPAYYREACEALELHTQCRSGPTCILLTAYDGERELLRAMKKVSGDRNDAPINNISLKSLLDISEPIDMVIRTGKEKRLSGAPLIPCSYAELVFLDDYFPALDRGKLETIWQTFKSRQRRFGQ